MNEDRTDIPFDTDVSKNPASGAPENGRINLIHYADHGVVLQIGDNVDDEVVQHLISALASTCSHMAASVMSGASHGAMIALTEGQGKMCDKHVYPSKDQQSEVDKIMDTIHQQAAEMEKVPMDPKHPLTPKLQKRLKRMKETREKKEVKKPKKKKL